MKRLPQSSPPPKNGRPASPAPLVVRSGGNNSQGAVMAVLVFAIGIGAAWVFLAPSGTSEQPSAKNAAVVKVIPDSGEFAASREEVTSDNLAAVEPSPAAVPAEPAAAPVPAPESPPAAMLASAASGVAARLGKEPVLVLSGAGATKAAEVARDKELVTAVANSGAWDDYRKLLSRSLAATLGTIDGAKVRERTEALWKEPCFYQAMLRWKVLGTFSADDIRARDYAKDLFSRVMVNNGAMEEILLTVKPGDDPAKVATLMADAWNTNPQQAEKYFNLALACAVVFDTEVKVQAVSESDNYAEVSGIQPLARYRWYVDKNERGKLATSVHKLSARDLVWVVCAPVATSELDWAVDKMQLQRSGWGNAFGMIKYLMERAVNGLNPYEEYTFAEILKEGGICGDQSYFCVNTARALGIPAMTLSGETDLGGHAWAAVKVKDDEWDTHIGRIGGASNGEAGNPQVGGSTSEQDVWLWNDKAQQSRLATLNAFRYLWISDYLESIDQPEAAESAVRIANTLGRSFSETWTRLHDVLVNKTSASGTPGKAEIVEAWVDFVDEMRKQFRENPRMATLAAKAEAEYIFPHAKEDDARRVLSRDRRRMERNSGEQKDLIADSLKREADLIQTKGAPGAANEISQLYDRALRDYGGSITGFKKMAEDYFSFAKADPETSRKAARDIELAFLRVVETGSKNWFRANTETSIYKMICGYYREAGDEAKAVKLEKRYIRLLKDAERGAL